MNKVLDILWKKIKDENYLILRNYENLEDDIGNGGDIDILCESKNRMIQILNAKPIREDEYVYNYTIYIGEQKISMDIREFGDEYYDKNWEGNMLRNKIAYKEFFIPEFEDYLYSLLYHALIHKKCIADKYKGIFETYFHTNNETELLNELKKYLNKKGYKAVLPVDQWVNFNKKNFAILTEKRS